LSFEDFALSCGDSFLREPLLTCGLLTLADVDVRVPLGGVAFGGVDGGLEKNFEALDGDAGAGFQAFEDRGGIAVEEVEIREVYGHVRSRIFMEVAREALEQECII
jgi:hypothetical protein